MHAQQSQHAQRGGTWTALLSRFLALAALWWVLTEGDSASWAIGGPAVAAGALLGQWLPAGAAWRISPWGVIRFLPVFAWYSLRGSIDVARRALHPRMPLAPRLLEHALRLPPGPASVFFANTLSLLPGSLCVELSDRCVRLHILDARLPIARQLAWIERLAAGVFGVSLREPAERPDAHEEPADA